MKNNFIAIAAYKIMTNIENFNIILGCTQSKYLDYVGETANDNKLNT